MLFWYDDTLVWTVAEIRLDRDHSNGSGVMRHLVWTAVVELVPDKSGGFSKPLSSDS